MIFKIVFFEIFLAVTAIIIRTMIGWLLCRLLMSWTYSIAELGARNGFSVLDTERGLYSHYFGIFFIDDLFFYFFKIRRKLLSGITILLLIKVIGFMVERRIILESVHLLASLVIYALL